MAVLAIVFDLKWLTVVIAYGFVVRLLTGPTLSPLGLLVTRVVRLLFEARPDGVFRANCCRGGIEAPMWTCTPGARRLEIPVALRAVKAAEGSRTKKTAASRLGAVLSRLPKGRALPESIWLRRHRGVVAVLWAHAVGIAAFGLLVGDSLSHAVAEGAVVAVFALAAGWGRGGRTARAVLASVGLLSASAILVHLSGGTIEMHFHFFVMLGVIALYQDWLTYLVAVGFVALHHGTVGVIDAHGVYNHPAAQAHPWTWAAIHAGFVLASSVVSLVAWRLNEQYRAQADRATQQEAIAHLSGRALSSTDCAALADEAVGLLTTTLEVGYASVLELRPDRKAFVIRAGVGWAKDPGGPAVVHAGPESHAGVALVAGQPVVIKDLRTDTRFPGSPLLRDNGVVSGAAVVIPGPEGPYGVMSVHASHLRSFDAHDLNFLEALANTLGGALRHKHAEEQLLHQALHDPLTHLPNRVLFHDRLGHALDRATRDSEHTAVALLNLDNFKAVNDSLGHVTGDELLVAVAHRLSDAVRAADTVARLGGDEFAILLEETVELEALGVVDRVLKALAQPLIVAGRPVIVEASIGMASSRDAEDGAALVRNADLAMYAAKSAGKGCIEVFHAGMHEAVLARVALEADLRQALEHALEGGEFHLLYQPKIAIATKRMMGVEALVRWQHPERGVVPALDFIPLAEETGLIVPIGAWILEEACRQSATWQARSADGLPLVMSVNVSARQFEPGLVDTVRQVLCNTGIDPATLCLELTESVLMHDVEAAVATLHELKALGVQISVDDFGTGYSSLTYLKRFPLDELKIDKSFVDNLGHAAEDGAIVAAIIGMAHALDFTVVGEGVETEAQLAKLQMLGCEIAQGYYFSRPQPAAAIDDMLAKAPEDVGSCHSGSSPSPIARGRQTVLVVDDVAEIRDVVRASLSPAGFAVHEAASGEEGLALARRIQPDCVLVDVNMPGGMSGFDVCRALRADASTTDCTVMMLTSSAVAPDKVEAFSVGADDYIIKPFVPRDLVGRLAAAVDRRNEQA